MRGLDQFSDVMDLIRNSDKYEAKVTELKNLLDGIKESSAQLGELRLAAAIRENAEHQLEAAKREIKELKDSANTEIKQSKDALAGEFAKVETQMSEARKLVNQAKDLEKQLKKKEKDLQDQEISIGVKKKALDDKESALKVQETEIAERLSKLRSVMNG